MKVFLEPFARNDKKEKLAGADDEESTEEVEDTKSKKDKAKSEKKKKLPYLELKLDNFSESILDSEKAALVFFISNDYNITKELSYFNQLVKKLKGPVNVGVFNITSNNSDEVK